MPSTIDVAHFIIFYYLCDYTAGDMPTSVAPVVAFGTLKNTGKLVTKGVGNLRINNMKDFFELDFGSTLKPSTSKTSARYNGQSIYRLDRKVDNPYLKKGDGFYLDSLHYDHIEVEDSRGKVKAVLNLDGTLTTSKTEQALKQRRTVKW